VKSRYIVTILSTVVLDLILVAWGLSHRDWISLCSEGNVWTLQAFRGSIALTHSEAWGRDSGFSMYSGLPWHGFYAYSGHPRDNWNYKHLTVVAVPFWSLALLAGYAPARHIIKNNQWWLFRRHGRRGFEPVMTGDKNASKTIPPPPDAHTQE
jgi:hypothetical protein